MRINTASPGGRPQNVSFVPLEKAFVCTVSANQLVLLRFVENSGITRHVFVPVDRKTMSVLTEKPKIWIVGGGGGGGGSTVRMVPPKP